MGEEGWSKQHLEVVVGVKGGLASSDRDRVHFFNSTQSQGNTTEFLATHRLRQKCNYNLTNDQKPRVFLSRTTILHGNFLND